jgi:hypothetical protein
MSAIAAAILSVVESRLETAAFDFAGTEIAGSALVPEAKSLFADFTAARAAGTSSAYLKTAVGAVQLVHDLLTEIAGLKGQVSTAASASAPEAANTAAA